jgi:hypothetical protein
MGRQLSDQREGVLGRDIVVDDAGVADRLADGKVEGDKMAS